LSKAPEHTDSNKGSILPWITAVLMVLGIAVLAALYWNRNVTVNEMEITGNYYTTSEEIEAKAAVPFGIQPDSLDLQGLVDRVESLHYVQKVTPYIEPSGDLDLTIHERQPIALLIKGSDRVYVDAEGVRLPILEGKTLDLPLVYGFRAAVLRDTLQTKEFQQIRDFLVGARINKFGWATISEVAYNKEEGVVALSHENGVKLIFGNNDFETKLRNWEAFYSDVIRTKGIRHMQQVDLRFMNQVVTRES
jgi:cell division septal protein FtsQ